ncbi:hypothetical protein HHI36_003277 [Cryptolaemus montrouzieri]|uniref:BEN domain-containing protein n=1 Tax=Cryptolaemus montrouzieri TaxID=559131 RepID=A0ABD2PCX8_9CUCU
MFKRLESDGDDSLSLHNYITFEIYSKKQPVVKGKRPAGWNVHELDSAILKEKLDKMFRGPSQENQKIDVEILTTIITKACDVAMPKRKTYGTKIKCTGMKKSLSSEGMLQEPEGK